MEPVTVVEALQGIESAMHTLCLGIALGFAALIITLWGRK